MNWAHRSHLMSPSGRCDVVHELIFAISNMSSTSIRILAYRAKNLPMVNSLIFNARVRLHVCLPYRTLYRESRCVFLIECRCAHTLPHAATDLPNNCWSEIMTIL